MRPTFLFCVALFVVPLLYAAPAPDLSKQKLDALKKRLPGLLNDWVNQEDNATWVTTPSSEVRVTCKPELRILRRISLNRAKAVVLFAAYADNERFIRQDVVLTAYLIYQDGCWTTDRFEASSRVVDSKNLRPTFAFLIMAIDEAAEKSGKAGEKQKGKGNGPRKEKGDSVHLRSIKIR